MSSVLVPDDTFAGQVYTVLNADETLQGTNYLNSTSSVYKYRRPLADTNNALVIAVDVRVQPDGGRMHSAFVTLSAFAPNIGKMPDGSRLSLIVTRAAEVAETMRGYGEGGIRVRTMLLLGKGGPYLEPQAPEEHWSYVRLQSLFTFT